MAGSIKDKYSPRKLGTIVDTVHIVIGVCEVILTVLAITDSERFRVLFPLIFVLAAVLSGITGWYDIVTYQKDTTSRLWITIYFVLAAALTVLFIVSAVSLWLH